MKMYNMARVYEKCKPEIDAQMSGVLQSGDFIGGTKVEELEEKLSLYTGCQCITCGNGTDALLMALVALGSKRVAVPAFGFPAAVEMCKLLGLDIVYVDIRDDFNIDPGLIPDVDTVIAMELFGVSCDYKAIKDAIGDKYLIIDAAQSFNYDFSDKIKYAECITTSFHPSKPYGCFGDGGAVFVSNSANLFTAYLRCYRNHGQLKKYEHYDCGINSRLDAIQAAVLLARYDFIDLERNSRMRIADQYNALLGKEDNGGIYSYYPIRVENNDVLKVFEKRGVPYAKHYPYTLNNIISGKCEGGCFPVAESVVQDIYQIPIDPYMSEKEIETVCEALHDIAIWIR